MIIRFCPAQSPICGLSFFRDGRSWRKTSINSRPANLQIDVKFESSLFLVVKNATPDSVAARKPWLDNQNSCQQTYQSWRASGTRRTIIQHGDWIPQRAYSNTRHLGPQSNSSTSSPRGGLVKSLILGWGQIDHQHGIQNSHCIDCW